MEAGEKCRALEYFVPPFSLIEENGEYSIIDSNKIICLEKSTTNRDEISRDTFEKIVECLNSDKPTPFFDMLSLRNEMHIMRVNKPLFDIRGYIYLTYQRGLTSLNATLIQGEFGKWVISKINKHE